MPASIHAGDVLAGRYRMVDLLSETRGGWFWCAQDEVLQRPVALHLISEQDPRADELMAAARRSAALVDRRNLRVLDADHLDGLCYVVNEWGTGESLDITLGKEGPLPPRRAAWLVAEVADTLAVAHASGKAHGRLVPENLLVDENGQVRVIGFAVDAALHGLPADRIAEDVVDLAALLYAALTGRWPTPTHSVVPAAPREHGRVLRPRQVRAGIPRSLDTLCDQVISPGVTPSRLPIVHREAPGLTSAEGIRAALEAYLGDPGSGAMNTAVIALAVQEADAQATDDPDSEAQASDEAADDLDAAPAPLLAAAAAETMTAPDRDDIPTEAGMPVFHDGDDEVEWLRARANRPAPPPAFEEPVERPLFAPDPVDGTPARRPRPPRPSPTGGPDEYWPWDTATGTSSGSGLLPAVPPETVPGRRWLRLAMLIGGAALVLLTVVAAYQLGGGGRGNAEEEPSGDASPTTSSDPSLEAFTGLTAADFDPEGDPPEEYPELAALAVDGDPGTVWRTSTYDQQFGPGGLKSGVGLTIDLGAERAVRQVQVTVVGAETAANVYVGAAAPTTMDGLQPVGAGTATGTGDGAAATITVDLDSAASGRYVTVWLTALPQVAEGFRGQIAEVVVSG